MSGAGGGRAALTASFRRWTRAQDTAEVLAAAGVGPWCVLTLLVVCLLAAAAWAPGARVVFGVPFGLGLACAAPMLGSGLAFSLLHRGRRHLETWGWVWLVLGVTALHFFLASLMALSELQGATLIASLLLFTTAFHGRLHRVTPRTPFLAVGTAAALLAALPLRESEDHLVLFGVIGPAALTAELYLGTFAVQHDRARAEAARLRAAVQAQLLDQQEQDVGRLSRALGEILGSQHELDSALMTAGGAADMLTVLGVGSRRLGPGGQELEALLKTLQESLRRIRDGVAEIHAKGRRHVGTEPEAVEVGPLLETVRASVGLRYPDVDIRVELETSPSPLRARMRGGPTTLRRVLENLVLNACEGDGARGATRVSVVARVEPLSGRLEVVITDDGPGFPPALLDGSAQALASSKSDGMGLGLYTSECLLRASGGVLQRENMTDGGALLRLVLPREYP
ncbi:ATP-binding protein [Myxococcus stipitatus]|uniref:sensor histidine kinase n=1 Tax=Myxococcus stipitatus TaxID=83455 RepID=UPI001F291204|nr:ATP-binding protein [Myxococcus stipitatus]MCE9668609.1 ATP-binding protein [Myxococcus stipitatus]